MDIGNVNVDDKNEHETLIKIPKDLLVNNIDDLLASIVSSTYLSLLQNLSHATYLQERTILAQIYDIINEVNNYFISLISRDLKVYLNSDNPCK